MSTENNKLKSISVNYKKSQKHYKTAKYPIRQPIYLTWLIWFLSKILLSTHKKKVERINMEGLKPPYMILSNHMSFVDMELVALGTRMQRVNSVVNLDGFYNRPWLLEWIGAIGTRKFTQDMHLIKSIKKVLDRGDVLCMYPEAVFSPCGVLCYIPDSLGALVKKMKVPVVVANHRGNHLRAPAWNYRQKRKVPFHTTLTKVLTPEEMKDMTVEEINKLLKNALDYDDYKYQKDNNILITEDYRANNIHKILYQCPHCKTESKMNSAGIELWCEECGKRWTLNEDGTLSAQEGETEFSHVPDWFKWQKKEVKKQIDSGRYNFEDEVDVFSQPHAWKYHYLGKAKLRHNENEGFVLEGNYRNKDYRIIRAPLENMSVHVEYDFAYVKKIKGDCFAISTNNDSFFCYPSKPNVVTKINFAVEEIYKKTLKTIKQQKTES